MRGRSEPVQLAGDHERRHRQSRHSVAQRQLRQRDPDGRAHIWRAGDQHPLVKRHPRWTGLRPERHVAHERVDERGREVRQRSPRAEQPGRPERAVEEVRERRNRDQQLVCDQVPDAGVDQRHCDRSRADVVLARPGGDRHPAERVPGDGGALTAAHRGGEHRLEILAEARDRVVLAGGAGAGAVAAQVVGNDANAACGQPLDHVGPQDQRLGPAVRQHDRRADLGAEHLGVQPGAVGRVDRQRAPGRGVTQPRALWVGRDPAQMA